MCCEVGVLMMGNCILSENQSQTDTFKWCVTFESCTQPCYNRFVNVFLPQVVVLIILPEITYAATSVLLADIDYGFNTLHTGCDLVQKWWNFEIYS